MINHRFKHQVGVVTGGARGIGKAIAGRLAAEGATVELLDINESVLRDTVGEFRAMGYKVHGSPVDLSEESSLRAAMNQVIERNHRLDITVNSAGIVGPNGVNIINYDAEEFEKVLAVNLLGAFLITKYSLPPMLKNQYGRILHISSIGGMEGNPNMVGYAASKAGLIGLIKGVGKEFAETGVTVNGMAPAVIGTEMNLDTDPKVLKYMSDKIPMKRLGTVDEVASLACWIVSKEASFNTAAVFDLSGGRAVY